MGSWENGVWKWSPRWRRELRDWEKDGEARFLNFLQQFELKEGAQDRQAWRGLGGEVFTVKAMYKEILNRNSRSAPDQMTNGGFGGIWNSRERI